MVTKDSTKRATRSSLVISALLHLALVFLLLTVGIPRRDDENLKITEISYIERYGTEVARRVTLKRIKPENILGKANKPSRSSGEKGEPKERTSPRTIVPSLRDRAYIPPPSLETSLPIDVHQEMIQRPRSMPDFSVDRGQLVGEKARLDVENLPFHVEEDLPSRSDEQADLELAMHIPVGGIDGGNRNFVGGHLSPDKRIVEDISAPTSGTGGGNALFDLAAGDFNPGSDGGSGGNGGGSGGHEGRGGGRGVATGRAARNEGPLAVPRQRKLQELSQEVAAESKERRSLPREEEPTSNIGVTVRISGQISNRRIIRSISPEYPEDARKGGIEGVVSLHLTVMPDGSIKDNVYVEETSGHRSLDRVAMRAVKEWLFAPLAPDVAQVEQWGIITVVFKLQ